MCDGRKNLYLLWQTGLSGDENVIILFVFFLWGFYVCYEESPFARLVMGTVLFLLLVPVNMILDTAVYWKISLWLVDFVAALGKFLFSLLAGGLIRYLRKNKHVIRLPERIWGMCALLCAAPLFVVLSFSFWYGFSPLEMEAEEFRLAYTILPFAALSAAAVLIAITVFSRQQEL